MASDELSEIVEKLRDLLQGLSPEELQATRARSLRKDPTRIPGSQSFVSTLAYGDLILDSEQAVHCEAVPGVWGFVAADQIKSARTGQPQLDLSLILTHFYANEPSILIQQRHDKPNTGTLVGSVQVQTESLLPATVQLAQQVILVFQGRALSSREPVLLTAEHVAEYPPVGATFVLASPVDLYRFEQLGDLGAPHRAALTAWRVVVTGELRLQP